MISNTAPTHSSAEDDLQLKRQLKALPDPEPSHGFDARLADLLFNQIDTAVITVQEQSGMPLGQAGGSVLSLGRLRDLLVAPQGLVIALSILLIVATLVGLQWNIVEDDLTKVDLLMLMSEGSL
jgi:hypothetical protein